MKIATFNVNGIGSRLTNLLEWLERDAPDIACLQELKAPDERFPEQDLAAAGYGAIWHGQTSWNGVAILARGELPKESRRGLPGDPSDTQSRYIEAQVGKLTVGCLYLPNGNPQPGPKFDYKLAWFARLLEYAKKLYVSKDPVVLCGDYNVVPTDFDIYDPKHWRRDALLQPESRDAYGELLEQGWVDALRQRHPEERLYTFWDYFRNHWPRDAGLRIDHLLLNEAAASRLASAGVDKWVRGQAHASDHAPTWVQLSDEPQTAGSKRKTPRKTAGAESKPSRKAKRARKSSSTAGTRRPTRSKGT